MIIGYVVHVLHVHNESDVMSETIITLYAFADLHGISRNEAHWSFQQGMIAGQKLGAGRQSAVVLEAKGMRDFFVQFHDTPGFIACDQCPHSI